MEASSTPAPFMQVADAARFLSPCTPAATWDDWANHASALYVVGRTGEAEAAAREALRQARNPATLLNLAVILETQSRFLEALPLTAEAYRLDPLSGLVRCQYSDALLRTGDFRRAWPLYVDSHGDWSWVRAVLPEWGGFSSLTGQRLLVLSAGGYGDTILYSRWLPHLRGLGAHVTLMCPRNISTLLAPLVDRTISGSIAGLDDAELLLPADYDQFVSMLSLGRYFCDSPEAIPRGAYLDAGPSASAHLLSAIGFCTRAGEEKFPRRHRSLNDMQSRRLAIASPLPIANLNFSSGSWMTTARLIASLSLVITVDTGVAHLAGALGVPCWVILPGLSAAYYGLRSSTSPFYASQRLFRNEGEGIEDAVSTICAALANWSPHAAS